MIPFTYVRAPDEARALEALREADTAVIAGGTTLVDLMRLHVMRPARVLDITGLPLDRIEELPSGGVRIGALVRNAELAHHAAIVERFPALSEALLAGASPQVRNMATTAGNLLQRTRCAYFRDVATSCNKREPGSGCAAIDGYTRSHAVLGTSPRCIAVHPSDMAVALVALDAAVHLRSAAGGVRTLPVADLHTLPGQHPEIESVLQPGELVTHIELPERPFAARSRYVKVRDRESFAFALASAAAAFDLSGRVIREARLALGGVATKPWRARDAEGVLSGRTPSPDLFRLAAEAALRGAEPRPHNAFKVELAKRTIVRALVRAAGMP
jgi:xanthine dehydrogenase YagS FAD-binding subunit